MALQRMNGTVIVRVSVSVAVTNSSWTDTAIRRWVGCRGGALNRTAQTYIRIFFDAAVVV